MPPPPGNQTLIWQAASPTIGVVWGRGEVVECNRFLISTGTVGVAYEDRRLG